MRFLRLRRRLACLLAALQIVVSAASVLTPQAYAQALDTQPPDVGFDTVDEARKGDSQVFTVTATDNKAIQSIVIFYRMGPDADYQRADMSQIGETDLYTLLIPADAIPESTEVIQYYIEARDEAGNRTLQGFSFDPAERALVDSPSSTAGDTLAADSTSPPAQEDTDTVLGSLSTTQKVVYTTLGVIVVGALIAAASGGGGGAGGETTQLTLVVPALDVDQ